MVPNTPARPWEQAFGMITSPRAWMFSNYPMYAYIPAKDVSRARKFYKAKVGAETRGGGPM